MRQSCEDHSKVLTGGVNCESALTYHKKYCDGVPFYQALIFAVVLGGHNRRANHTR
jgi:hypothetical protein